MLPWLVGPAAGSAATQGFGNPSATYGIGRAAWQAVDDARKTVSGVLGCRPADVTFTSGGTESVNAALKGVAFALKKSRAGNHIVTTAVEHHAVLHTCNYLEEFGFDVTYLDVDAYGRVDPEEVARAVTDRTVLVSVMLANNEVGTIQPVREVVERVAERGRQLRKRIPVHTDAIQAPGLLPLDVEALGVDLLSLSGHKFGGPKGTGVLYIRRGTPYVSQINGGGQERQRRAGTENVAGIVGQARALSIAEDGRESNVTATRRLRDSLIECIPTLVPDSRLNGHPTERLANNVNVSFRGVRGDKLVSALDRKGIAASAGAACGSQTWEPSHVLLAMGLSMPEAVGGLRLSVASSTTDAQIDRVLEVLPGVVKALRGQAVGAR